MSTDTLSRLPGLALRLQLLAVMFSLLAVTGCVVPAPGASGSGGPTLPSTAVPDFTLKSPYQYHEFSGEVVVPVSGFAHLDFEMHLRPTPNVHEP